VHDEPEMPPGQMARIGPAFQLQRLGLVGVLAMRRGWIGIAAVGTDQPVYHRL
jgi:hypothetical protein